MWGEGWRVVGWRVVMFEHKSGESREWRAKDKTEHKKQSVQLLLEALTCSHGMEWEETVYI